VLNLETRADRDAEGGLGLRRGSDVRGVVDRYWVKLQPRRRFLVFGTRLGSQRCGCCDIQNSVIAYFD